MHSPTTEVAMYYNMITAEATVRTQQQWHLLHNPPVYIVTSVHSSPYSSDE